MLNGLQFVLIHVPSLEQVLPFYTEKLGFELESRGPDFAQFITPGGQGATLALSADGPSEPRSNIELWWYVDDIEATQAELQSRDVPIVDPLTAQPFGHTLAIQDPAGNKLFLLQLAQQ
ncbi:MAG TPA: VOC family protein [Ktedonobacteraceae bacterium]|nr:VOC family protein [Ktedonobacteraceae bacterium]